MRPLILRPEARRDALAAYRWYERRRAGLGTVFRDRLDEQLIQIRSLPASFPIAYRGLRRARMSNFPYLVFFRDDEDAIRIVAVMHARRNPDTLRNRQ